LGSNPPAALIRGQHILGRAVDVARQVEIAA